MLVGNVGLVSVDAFGNLARTTYQAQPTAMLSPKRLTLLTYCVLIFFTGCQNSRQTASSAEAASSSPKATLSLNATFTVATFNIQNFGPTKAGKLEIMETLATIIRKYDVVAVQEVSDISGQAPQKLLVEINKSGAHYALLLSERTGKQADDKTSQEQYAFFYNTSKIQARDAGALYPDGEHDYFQREPFVAGFKAGDQNFVLITVHTRPESAVAEIGALAHVVDWARTYYTGEDDFITLGDFNAGGTYANPAQLHQLESVDFPYHWIVPDSNDSTVATTTSCPYDRIVVSNGMVAHYHNHWGTDQAFTDKQISDHWPVWAEFSIAP